MGVHNTYIHTYTHIFICMCVCVCVCLTLFTKRGRGGGIATDIIFPFISKKPTRVAAPSPRASLGRRTVCGRTEHRRPPVLKRYETKVIMVYYCCSNAQNTHEKWI